MSRWSFEPILESYFAVLAMATLLIGLLWAIRPWSQSPRRGRSWILFGLRAGVVLLLLLAMLRPTHVSTQSRPQSATLLVLFDQSRSMGVTDSAGGESRWRQQSQVLQSARDELQKLQKLFEIRLYGFDQELADESFRDGTLKLPLEPRGQQTDIALSLSEALQREAGKRLAGVVLLTDGAQRVVQPRFDLQQVVRELARMNTPLYTVVFGKPRDQAQSRDVAVERLQDQYTVFVKNELEIRSALRVQGYVNRPIPVRLFIEGPPGVPPTSLGPLELTANEDDQLVDFSFVYAPEVAGSYQLRVEAPAQDGELVVANNQLTAYLNVLEGGLRVLYLEGNLLSGEQQILRESLGTSPDIELDYRAIDPRLRAQWPIDLSEIWKSKPYDVLLIGDVDSTALGEDNLRRIAAAVEQGTGLMMLGGLNTLAAGGYGTTPLADLLPINFARFSRQEFGADQPVREELHRDGPLVMVPTRPHFITHLGTAGDNVAAWRRLKPLLGANRIESLKPQAIRLAEADNEQRDPLLVARQYDRGRVLVFAGDSTHRWWRYGQQDAHKRFWRQAMLWLASKDELLRRDVWVRLDRRRFRPGELISLTAGARAENGDVIQDAILTAEVKSGSGPPRPVSLVRDQDDWSAELDDLREPGQYTVDVTATQNGQIIGQASAQFQVQRLDLELADPAANPQQLAALSGLTSQAGGRSVPPENLNELLDELLQKPPEMEIEVETKWQLGDTAIDSWLLFVTFVGLLGAEWFLPKSGACPSALSQLKLRVGWPGSNEVSPRKIAVWGLTSFDPRHPKIKL